MKRLTHKSEENYKKGHYSLNECGISKEQRGINKLGQLEDLMEKYGIEDIKDLERRIAEYVLPQSQPELSKYKLIEKELGIDLITLFKHIEIKREKLDNKNCVELRSKDTEMSTFIFI